MELKEIKNKLVENYPSLTVNKDLLEEILAVGKLQSFAQGQKVIDYGKQSHFIPLILEGTLKVSRMNDQGNEVFLYTLGVGETCATTIDCCMEGKLSEIQAFAESDGVMWGIPKSQVNSWLDKYKHWTVFMLQSYQHRFNELLYTVDQIAFSKLDERLLAYLKKLTTELSDKTINTTHDAVAADLNSSREVISRLLKKLEKEGVIKLARNKITLV